MATITIDLQPEEKQQLEALATRRGKGYDVEALLKDVIGALIHTGKESPALLASKSFDELLEPFWRGFAEGGMSERDAEILLDSELEAVRAERYAHRNLNG